MPAHIPEQPLTPFGHSGRGLGAWHVPLVLPEVPSTVHEVDVLVIGGGQAGLAAAYYLQEAGFAGFAPSLGRHSQGRNKAPCFIVLDAEDGPGGAWQHRWPSLTMECVNDIADLPGKKLKKVDPQLPARIALTQYFTDYEDTFDLPIMRPVRVLAVERMEDSDRLRVATERAEWHARVVIAATGTWRRPFWPYVPGHDVFRGRQLHTHEFVSGREFDNKRVIVVGGGISAVDHLLEISEYAHTTWVTRRPPEFRDAPFDEAVGQAVEDAVRERTAQGLRPLSVVSYTGILRTPAVERGIAEGVLRAKPMFSRLVVDGAQWANGRVRRADVILWATGFRPDVPYLRPMHLRTAEGGFRMEGTRVAGEPRLHFVGLGADSSTVGARRSARKAVREISKFLGLDADK